jgi:uncharacterized protein YbjQ (UPF0145 family)
VEQLILQVGVPLVLIIFGWVFGIAAEKKHYRSIHRRENLHLAVPILSASWTDFERPIQRASLATGSVVISIDAYKKFFAGLRRLFGGELVSYAPLLDRARREAILRMRASSPDADAFLNCRLETSTISGGSSGGMGTVEVLAFGTAVWLKE